ncbi:MAG: thioredoxin [Cyanobacteria bacterium P01_C01_bin.72]
MSAVTKANFVDTAKLKELLAQEKLVVVDYTASWCGPCKVLAPSIDRLATEYQDRVTVVKVDIEQNPDNAKEYGIRSIPAVLIFESGELSERVVGKQPYETYSNILETKLKA